MQTFPMFLRVAEREVVIAGGGEQAAQKCRLMLKTEAKIRVIAPEIDEELNVLADEGLIVHDTGQPTPDRFSDAALVFIASGCPGLDAALHALAKEAGALVNVVDQPALCDAITPSLVDRDPVVIAIGTEGNAPVLGRQLKTRIEEMLEPNLGDLARLAGRLRGAVAARVPREARRDFWRWVFSGAPRKAHARGSERDAARRIKAAINDGGSPDYRSAGALSLIDGGAGQADLMTLRSVQRLQEADVIFYDADCAPGILELARRDAERQPVDAGQWPVSRLAGVVSRHVQDGQSVVRLIGMARSEAMLQQEHAALENLEIAVEELPSVPARPSPSPESKRYSV
ncbi:MAG: NAD(P)-dependent oxidoreductase [Pseudomonadota bacterium]